MNQIVYCNIVSVIFDKIRLDKLPIYMACAPLQFKPIRKKYLDIGTIRCESYGIGEGEV